MKHLREEGYTYFQHLIRAWTISFVCLVHGVFPFVWEHKASDIINSKWPLKDQDESKLVRGLCGWSPLKRTRLRS